MRYWHVLYTRSRNEKKVAERLQSQGYQMYCPLVNTMRQWSDRKKKVQVPMFSGYIFACIDEKERMEIVQDPGVINFVYWLGKPALMRDREIAAIKEIEEKGHEIEISQEQFQVGDEMEIDRGTFKGLKGTILDIDRNKFRIWLDPLQCTITFNYKSPK